MYPQSDFENFRDDLFLARNVLSKDSVLEYFYLSQFFDTSSLNQKQRRGLVCTNQDEGILYRLVFAKEKTSQPDGTSSNEAQWNFGNNFGVFVIQKILRDSKEIETPLDGEVFTKRHLLQQSYVDGVAKLLKSWPIIECNADCLLDCVTTASSWSLIEGYTWSSIHDQPSISLSDASSNTSESQNSNKVLGKKRPSHVEMNLYTKRSCNDISHIIETLFRAVSNEAQRFNTSVEQFHQSAGKNILHDFLNEARPSQAADSTMPAP